MKQFILNDSESIWNILTEGEDCVQLINNTDRQVWFLVLPSSDCDGIVAFKGQQDHVDQRFDDHLNPKLPHALPFNAKEGSAMKSILWDSESNQQWKHLSNWRIWSESDLQNLQMV